MPTPTELSDGLPAPQRYAAIIAVSCGSMVTAVDGSIANIALPTLSRDLQIAPSEAVLVITIYQLVLMMTLLPFSALGQRRGYRATFYVGMATFVAASTMCFFAHTLAALVAVRALQAVGSAAVLSVNSALIRHIYPLARLGRGLSLNTVIAAASASFGPTVGGAILTLARWPWLFCAVSPVALAAMWFGRALPQSERHADAYDFLGAGMCAATFGLMVVGLESAVQGSSAIVAASSIVASLLLGTAFVRRELGQSHPVLPVDLMRVRRIALPCLGSLAAYLGLSIVTVALPYRLQMQFHFTPAAAGAALVPIALVSVVVAPVSGLLSDRVDAGLLGAIGMAIGVVGMLCLVFLPAAPSQIDLLWRVAMCGFGFGMFFSPNARQIVGVAPPARSAAAGALFSTTRGAGQTLGATAIAALLALGLGLGPAPALIGAGFALVAGICCVSVLRGAKPVRLAESEL